MSESSNSGKLLRVAVDAMGGDCAPEEIVKGAAQAAKELGVEIILVGLKSEIEKELGKIDVSNLPISIVEATDLIKDGEEAVYTVLRKPNSSVAVAAQLVKEGKAEAVVSAGSTGASTVCAFQYLGALPGLERPMGGGAFLQLAPNTVVVDLGANVGCQPFQLVDFAVAGSVYARSFLGIDEPTIGLLNVGAEEGKGNNQAKEAYSLLKKSGLNFIGNVEGMDIPLGKANVIVCDGFVGNILIKFCEGIGRVINHWLSKELKDTLSPADLESITTKLHGLTSPAVALGGGPLLGVNGIFSIAHGSSRAPQIAGTVRNTKIAVETGFVDKLRTELEKVQVNISSNE